MEKKREFTGLTKNLITYIAICWSLFQMAIAGFWTLSPQILRAIHLAFGSVLIIALYPPTSSAKGKRFWNLVDFIMIALTIAILVFFLGSQEGMADRAGEPMVWDIIFGTALTVIVLEIARRTEGGILSSIGLAFILYGLWGPIFPGLLAHRGFTFGRIMTYLFESMNGIYGMALGVSATLIFTYMLYGNLLAKTGAGKFFVDLVLALMGKSRSGPGKALVASNALMATISGVPAATVTSIGSLIFPLMVKVGYKRMFTGALGATAAIGTTITPPVMGSAAFIMAELTGISYGQIMLASIIPAALFFLSLFVLNEANCAKTGIKARPRTKGEALRLLKSGWFYLLPIFSLVYLIVIGYSPMTAAFWSIILIMFMELVITLINGKSGGGISGYVKNMLHALEATAYDSLMIMATCAVADIITGSLAVTGLAGKFSAIMLQLSGGQILPALIFTAIASILLGLGLPIAACYIVLAVIAGPALVTIGVPLLTAHYFIFYYGNFSAISPPVAIPAYAAAGMLGEDPWTMGWKASWLAMPALITGFAVVYSPGLMMQGSISTIVLDVVLAIIGVAAMSFAIEKWLWRKMSYWEATLLFLTGVLAMIPHKLFAGTGMAFIIAISVFLYLTRNRYALAEKQPAV